MNFPKIFIFFVLFFLISSCSGKEEEKISIIEEESLELQMMEVYKDGIKLTPAL